MVLTQQQIDSIKYYNDRITEIIQSADKPVKKVSAKKKLQDESVTRVVDRRKKLMYGKLNKQ